MLSESTSIKVPFVDLSRGFKRDRVSVFEYFETLGLNSNFILGDIVSDFETRIADYLNANYCISVNSGSDALWLSLKALDIGPGDEVITVGNSFIATVWAIAAVGATPVIVDVGLDMNISPDAISDAVTTRTKAIVSVHLAGNPAELTLINKLANEFNLLHVEDCAQAIGAEYSGVKIGSESFVAAFSLHPLKNLGVWGDGGFVVTSERKLYDKLKLLRNHGLIDRDNVSSWGFNSRLDAFQAAVAIVRLDLLDKLNDRRISIADYYRNSLENYIDFQQISDSSKCVFHNCIARSTHRNEIIEFARLRGIELKIHYPIPVHRHNINSEPRVKCGRSLAMTEMFSQTIFSMPIFPELTDSEVNAVETVIRGFFK